MPCSVQHIYTCKYFKCQKFWYTYYYCLMSLCEGEGTRTRTHTLQASRQAKDVRCRFVLCTVDSYAFLFYTFSHHPLRHRKHLIFILHHTKRHTQYTLHRLFSHILHFTSRAYLDDAFHRCFFLLFFSAIAHSHFRCVSSFGFCLYFHLLTHLFCSFGCVCVVCFSHYCSSALHSVYACSISSYHSMCFSTILTRRNGRKNEKKREK